MAGELAAAHAVPAARSSDFPAQDRDWVDARAEAARLIAAVNDDFEAVLGVLDRECEQLRQAGPDARASADLAGVDRALREARALTRMLRAFSRREIQRARTVDVNTLLEGMRPMLARVFAEGALIDLELEC